MKKNKTLTWTKIGFCTKAVTASVSVSLFFEYEQLLFPESSFLIFKNFNVLSFEAVSVSMILTPFLQR